MDRVNLRARCSYLSIPDLGPTQTPVKRVPGLFPGGGGGLKLQRRGVDPHSHIAPRLKKELY